MPQSTTLCEEPNVFSPATACHEGCAILDKIRHVVIKKGTTAIIEWPLRHPGGAAVDLTYCFPTEQSTSVSQSLAGADAAEAIKARFAACDGGEVWETEGIVHDVTTGTIRFAVPSQIYQDAGIYAMDMAVIQIDGTTETPIFIDSGLLSVEGSMWGNLTQRTQPPTLNDIRLHLRDTHVENELLADVEFDAQEILGAIVRPIRQWNETPPPVACYTCKTFPYRYHWMQAVVGELLRTSAHHYMRNNLKMNHGGLTGNFKDKYQEYLAVATQYTTEWKTFINEKKIEINISGAFGSITSSYSSW